MNKDKINERAKQWYMDNKEKSRERRRKWYQDNKQKVKLKRIRKEQIEYNLKNNILPIGNNK